MKLTTASFSTYDLFAFSGEMKISSIPEITPLLYKHIQANQGKDIVLELSKTRIIDSSALRLLINLKKTIESHSRRLYLLSPSQQVLELLNETRLSTQFTVINDLDLPSSQPHLETVSQYHAYTNDERGLRRLQCLCAVCGSQRVVGYLTGPGDFVWSWEGDDPFPISRMNGCLPVDAFSLLPIMCIDCLMCSIQPRHFNAGREGATTIRASLDDHSKLLLSKGIKARKRLADTEQITFDEETLRNPRPARSSYYAFRFASICAGSMAVDRVSASPFTIGWLSYLTIKYAPDEKKQELIDSCRTWMTQVVSEPHHYSQTELAQAYFVLLNACMHLDKMKEAFSAQAGLGELASLVPVSDTPSMENPRFWHLQAQNIWRKEINQRSEEVRLR